MGNKKEAKRRRNKANLFKRRTDIGNNNNESAFIGEEVLEEIDEPVSSASSRKLDGMSLLENDEGTSDNPQYIIMDSGIIEILISAIGVCPLCQNKYLNFYNDQSKKKGFANYLSITCSSSSCDFSFTTYSIHHVNKPNTPGTKPFGVIARCIVAFREIGKGYNSIEKCFGLMNCLPSMDIY